MKRINSMLRSNFFRCYSTRNMAIIAIIIVIVDFLRVLTRNDLTLGDTYFLFFEGYGLGYLDISSYLFFIIVNGIPLYFSSLVLDGRLLQSNSYILTRYKSKASYFSTIQISYVFFLIGYLALHILTIFISGVLLGKDLGFGNYTNDILSTLLPSASVNIPLIFVMSFILRILELISIQGVIVVLQSLTKKVSVSFLLIVCGYMLVVFIPFLYYPFGLSSMLDGLHFQIL